jgi:hypothetical protein
MLLRNYTVCDRSFLYAYAQAMKVVGIVAMSPIPRQSKPAMFMTIEMSANPKSFHLAPLVIFELC